MLVECVPNFSEGRRADVIEAIVTAIRNGGAVHILDVSSDVDHNRSVVTVVGPPNELENAIYEGICTAAEQIDLTEHEGVHPRLGATDVVPFIPLQDATMEDCIQLAHRLGERVGSTLHLPVYLYEQAATSPARRNLAALRNRHFQFEALSTAIQTDPSYMPDYGPATLGPAGAVIIGAREALIAFNVFLNTDEVEIADAIAQTIRESSGGLPYVKALGLLVNGQAQVSMNLTDYRQTPIYRVVEAIRHEAEKHGTSIDFSELIGLVPQEAILDSAGWYLKLADFTAGRVLETRIDMAERATSPISIEEPPVPDGASLLVPPTTPDEVHRPTAFVEAVAALKPTPAGGAVAALVGALSAALTHMTAGISYRKSNITETQFLLDAVMIAAGDLQDHLLDQVVRDVVAFEELLAIYRMPSDSPKREQHIQEKAELTAEVPLTVCRMALEVMQLARQVVLGGHRVVITDALTAVYMAKATIDSAALTTKINLSQIQNQSLVTKIRNELRTIQATAYDIYNEMIHIADELVGKHDG